MSRSFYQGVFGMPKALLLLLAATPAAADVGAVSVEVVDAVTRRPIDGVTITAESRDGEVRSATTDNGRALLDSEDATVADAFDERPGQPWLWLGAVALGALLGTQLGLKWLPVRSLRYALVLVLLVAAGKLLLG